MLHERNGLVNEEQVCGRCHKRITQYCVVYSVDPKCVSSSQDFPVQVLNFPVKGLHLPVRTFP